MDSPTYIPWLLQYVLHAALELSEQNSGWAMCLFCGLPVAYKVNSMLFSVRFEAVHHRPLYY